MGLTKLAWAAEQINRPGKLFVQRPEKARWLVGADVVEDEDWLKIYLDYKRRSYVQILD